MSDPNRIPPSYSAQECLHHHRHHLAHSDTSWGVPGSTWKHHNTVTFLHVNCRVLGSATRSVSLKKCRHVSTDHSGRSRPLPPNPRHRTTRRHERPRCPPRHSSPTFALPGLSVLRAWSNPIQPRRFGEKGRCFRMVFFGSKTLEKKWRKKTDEIWNPNPRIDFQLATAE